MDQAGSFRIGILAYDLRRLLPRYIVTAIHADRLTTQCTRCARIEISVHRRAIPAIHHHMTLRRHVSRKYDIHRLHLGEAICNRHCRRHVKLLATWRGYIA